LEKIAVSECRDSGSGRAGAERAVGKMPNRKRALRETRIIFRMVPSLVVHTRAREASARRYIAVDAPSWIFAPRYVEGGTLRKEL
jgi:hypothetical protein